MAISHLLPHGTASAARPPHRPPSPSIHRPPSPARARSPAPSIQAVPSTSKPIPIKDPTTAATLRGFARRSSQAPTSSPTETVPGGPPPASREATLAQAIRHNDLRALVQNQERARSSARTPRPASPNHHVVRASSCSRSRVAIPSLGGVAGSLTSGEGSEASGESVDIPIMDMQLRIPDSAAVGAASLPSWSRPAAGGSISPSGGAASATSRLPPSGKRRLSCLATYTGVFPDQQQYYPSQPTRSMSARAASPELRYSLSIADRRGSAPPAPRPFLGKRLSTSLNSSGSGGGGAHTRPPSPAPPGFKTSSRRGSGGGGIDGFSPISLRTEEASPTSTVMFAKRASVAAFGRGRSPSPTPAPTPRGLVRAASPSPCFLPPRAQSPSPKAPSAASMATDPPPNDGIARDGPLIVRGFDAPALGPKIGSRPSSPSAMSSTTLRSKRSSSNMTRGGRSSCGGSGSDGSGARSAGPIVRPRASLLDRTADQRLEVRASRDFEQIDEYYATRYAGATAAAQAVANAEGGQEAGRRGAGSSRDQRAAKRLAEERLRRGYDRTR